MNIFWRLKKERPYFVALELKRLIPELKNVNSDDLESQLRDSKLLFYSRESTKTPWYIRLTLPFALLFVVILFIILPFNYIATGRWGYKIEWIKNWLNALHLNL